MLTSQVLTWPIAISADLVFLSHELLYFQYPRLPRTTAVPKLSPFTWPVEILDFAGTWILWLLLAMDYLLKQRSLCAGFGSPCVAGSCPLNILYKLLLRKLDFSLLPAGSGSNNEPREASEIVSYRGDLALLSLESSWKANFTLLAHIPQGNRLVST